MSYTGIFFIWGAYFLARFFTVLNVGNYLIDSAAVVFFLLALILPLLGILNAIASFSKKEKNIFYGVIGLILSLAVLLFVLVNLPFSFFIYSDGYNSQPIIGASDALESAYQTPSALENSQSVTFTQDYTLSKRAIVERANIGISEDQVCLSLGDYQYFVSSGFNGGVLCQNVGGDCSNENKISYGGGGNKDVKLSVLCYEGQELPLIVGNSPEAIYKDIDKDWVSECECVTDPDLQEQICCAVMLRVPR